MKGKVMFVCTVLAGIVLVGINAFGIDGYPGLKTPRGNFLQEANQFRYPPSTQANKSLLAGFFGGLFGGEDVSTDDGLLATYDIKLSGDADLKMKYESLSDYIINKWALLLVNGVIPLTTPVRLSKNDNAGDTVSCRLIFEKVDTSYKNKKEEDSLEEGNDEPKKKEIKQGGVEVVILSPSDDDLILKVRVTRCEIDDDTMIKEMSEEKILKELQKAIDIWKQEAL